MGNGFQKTKWVIIINKAVYIFVGCFYYGEKGYGVLKLLEYIKKKFTDPEEIKDVCNSVIQRMNDLDSRPYNIRQDEYDEWDSVTELAYEILEAFDNESISSEEIEDMCSELVDMINDFQAIYGGLSRWQV